MIVSFDIETGGLDKENHSVLELGAVAYAPESDGIVDEFEVVIDNEVIHGDAYALSMHSRIFECLKNKSENGYRVATPLGALSLFSQWLKQVSPDKKPNALGLNVSSFDLQWKVGGVLLASLFHHRSIEVGSYLAGTLRLDFPISGEEAAQGIIGRSIKHTALGDAYDALAIYRYARNLHPVVTSISDLPYNK